MNKAVTILLFILAVISTQAVPAHALYTDDTGTQGFMKYSLDVYGEFGWDHDGSTKTTDQLLETDLYAGLLNSVDLVVGIPLYWQQARDNDELTRDNGGISDITLDLKWRFLELGPVSFAIKPGVILPTGDHAKGLGADRMGYACMLISTLDIKPFAVHANIGYSHQNMLDEDRAVSRLDGWKLALGAVYDLADTFHLKGEVVSETNGDNTSKTWPSFMTAQAYYDLNDNLSVNAGVRWGLNNQATDIVAITGFTVNFP